MPRRRLSNLKTRHSVKDSSRLHEGPTMHDCRRAVRDPECSSLAGRDFKGLAGGRRACGNCLQQSIRQSMQRRSTIPHPTSRNKQLKQHAKQDLCDKKLVQAMLSPTAAPVAPSGRKKLAGPRATRLPLRSQRRLSGATSTSRLLVGGRSRSASGSVADVPLRRPARFWLLATRCSGD
ncbi:uncharacterized protein BDZ99DRAFT_519041 [Mytilinidion resinicola]|uniref:Uncharacterized protein n=1 Tax=Mytilinidion resinicola TaxID=574789 RepID=A0A6A6YUX3_9PEZI|nr:uncharacterized protein BDZ99DRAFT_519041 [Mytilinidion resinicola]KAF2811794.1 hypothetical protein BDZ99DRAFT_519041 [Mytilinidion resinicola]